MRIDTERSRATPEGVTLGLRVAGPPARLLAWTIDAIVLVVAQFTLALLAATLGVAGLGFYYLLFFALFWFYPVAFEVLRGGATPGKSSIGLQVVHDDGTPVGSGPPSSASTTSLSWVSWNRLLELSQPVLPSTRFWLVR